MRLIDADALRASMYHEAFENDASYDEKNPQAKWDSGLWVRYKMFERCLESAPSIEPKIKPIEYRDCANAMLTMWMDNVVTDGEYNRIMDKLNEYWRVENGRLDKQTGCD